MCERRGREREKRERGGEGSVRSTERAGTGGGEGEERRGEEGSVGDW